MEQIMAFNFNHQDQTWAVRVVMIDGEPWWIAKDVCNVLEIGNITWALKRLDEDEFSSTKVTDSSGRSQQMYVVNEPGLYSLILGSRKPEAKQFKRWVVHDVLPQIRKTGMYVQSGMYVDGRKLPTNYLEALEALVDTEKDRLRLEAEVQALTPKAEAYNVLLSGKNAQTISQVAKAFGTGRNRLFAFLREKKVLMKNNLPYQEYLARGYFKVREVSTTRRDTVVNVTQTLVTAKGIDLIRSLLSQTELKLIQ
ncbi:MAG: phage antirepressor KilAC domain-containing protein [Alicyclobacillus sp.]|nr:phage antirepressor KilAC domain-containing protein [Alicyclobacillus sp.]